MTELKEFMEELKRFFPEYSGDEKALRDLADYYRDLKVLSEQRVSIQFNNKGKDHAILVMSEIFAKSHKRIKIFAGNFDGSVSNNALYTSKLQEFLGKAPDTSIEVVFEQTPNPNSKALLLLKEKKNRCPNQVSLKLALPEQIKKFQKYIVNETNMIHFTIGDNEKNIFNKYRCETDVRKFVAILNFDDNTGFCNTLEKMHDILSENANTL